MFESNDSGCYSEIIFTEDTVERYAQSSQEADHKSACNTLKSFYPTLKSNVDKLEMGFARQVVNRTIASMLHLDKTFSMQSTFDEEHFNQCIREAHDYIKWLESDAIDYPESLRYKSDIISNMEEELSEEETGPVMKRRGRGPAADSKYNRARLIVKEDITNNIDRHETIVKLRNECELGDATSESYYSKIKKEIANQD
jgi:hypothetical protein